MADGRRKTALTFSQQEHDRLQSMARSRALAHRLVIRARIALLAAEGERAKVIAQRVGTSEHTVLLWWDRLAQHGIEAIHDEPRPGRPRTVSDDEVSAVVQKTLETKPGDGSHWTCRTLAQATGLSKSTVHRVWNAFSLQPHRQRHFKLSPDPLFVDKVRDIVGLYLDPPHKALVLAVDEKSQIQVLERTQPMLPMAMGYVEGITHDYHRHGTLTLYAALDVATGQVLAQTHRRHRHQEFLAFLRHIDASVPADLDVHLIVDNYSTHRHGKVRSWLARHPRYHVHFTPTYSSWLNQVEIWFHQISQRTIRRASCKSPKELVAKIQRYIEVHNANTRPFAWTATADAIFEKIKRLCQGISGT